MMKLKTHRYMFEMAVGSMACLLLMACFNAADRAAIPAAANPAMTPLSSAASGQNQPTQPPTSTWQTGAPPSSGANSGNQATPSQNGNATGGPPTSVTSSGNQALQSQSGNASVPTDPGTVSPNQQWVTEEPASPNRVNTLPSNWDKFQYAFFERIEGQAGGASAWSLELYLTDNPNFCVQSGNGMIGNVLSEGEQVYAFHFNPSVRGPFNGSYVGPADYGPRNLFVGVQTLSPNDATLSPNTCTTQALLPVYEGNVVIVFDVSNGGDFNMPDNSEGVTFTVTGVPANVSSLATQSSAISRTMKAQFCRATYPLYQAQMAQMPPGEYGSPYDVWHWGVGPLPEGPCTAASAGAAGTR